MEDMHCAMYIHIVRTHVYLYVTVCKRLHVGVDMRCAMYIHTYILYVCMCIHMCDCMQEIACWS